jgi:hypothetical protein
LWDKANFPELILDFRGTCQKVRMLFFGVGIRPYFQPYNPGTIYDTAPSYRLDVHFTPFILNRPDERFTVNQSSSFQQSYQKNPAVLYFQPIVSLP